MKKEPKLRKMLPRKYGVGVLSSYHFISFFKNLKIAVMKTKGGIIQMNRTYAIKNQKFLLWTICFSNIKIIVAENMPVTAVMITPRMMRILGKMLMFVKENNVELVR